MSLWKIAWRSIQQRSLASALTALSMALGVMLVVAVLSIHGVVSESFRNNTSLGYNMIVGAKGGKLQLTLNTVYYLSSPVENIPYDYYLEFFTAEKRQQELENSFASRARKAHWQAADTAALAAGASATPGAQTLAMLFALDALNTVEAKQQSAARDGMFGPFTDLAIPVCLGDYFGRFRVVGTAPAMFDDLTYGEEGDKKYAFAAWSELHSPARVFRLLDADKDGKATAAEAPASHRALAERLLWLADTDRDGALTERELQDAAREYPRNFQHKSRRFGFFEAVIGSTVAREKGIHLGDQISPAHGDPEGQGHDNKFTIVGILEPSGTPNDRAVFVNIEGFYLMEDHAKPIEQSRDEIETADEELSETPDRGEATSKVLDAESHLAAETSGKEHTVSPPANPLEPLPVEQREVTAILIRTSPIFAIGMPNTINEGNVAQAVLPVREIHNLFAIFVRPIQWVLLTVTAMICIVSGVSILVSIYNSMSDRRHEIAVMRALGASRGTVMSVILLESIFLSLGGGALGWIAGHVLNAAANPWIEEQTGVSVGFLSFAPAINVLELLDNEGIMNISPELLLVPALILLAIVVGFLPAMSAYRTDVAKALGS
jgi:putative ABC transport system permease protein